MMRPSGAGHPWGVGGLVVPWEKTHWKHIYLLLLQQYFVTNSERLCGIYREGMASQRPLSDFGQEEQQAIRQCAERQVETMMKMPTHS